MTKQDKLTLRKFQIVEGYSNPIVIDEEKPGIRSFDTIWQKDGTLTTFQVKRVRESSPAKSLINVQSQELKLRSREGRFKG